MFEPTVLLNRQDLDSNSLCSIVRIATHNCGPRMSGDRVTLLETLEARASLMRKMMRIKSFIWTSGAHTSLQSHLLLISPSIRCSTQ